MKISNDRIADQLNRKLLPAYLLVSDEPLLLGEAADAIRRKAREQGFGTRELMFVERGFDWNDLYASGANLSLFSERRILELRMPTGKPGKPGAAALVSYLDNPPEDTLLLVLSGRLDKSARRGAWVRTFEKKAVMYELPPVPPAQLPRWISARMKAAELDCPIEVARMLADRVEGNLLAAAQEIEKLRLANGPGRVDADTVLRSVADSARFDVFTLADAALVGDAARLLRVIEGLRVEGVAVPLVVWALNSTLHQLALVAWHMHRGLGPDAAMAKAHIWSNRRTLVRAAVKRHGFASLYRMLARLGQIDRAGKGQGPGDPWAMIRQLACEMAGVAPFTEPVAMSKAG